MNLEHEIVFSEEEKNLFYSNIENVKREWPKQIHKYLKMIASFSLG